MALIEGTATPKTLIAEYDFAIDGGTVAAHTLRGVSGWDNSVPTGSVITGGQVQVITAPTSGGSATVALKIEGTADLMAATAIASLTAGNYDVVPDSTGTSFIKTTAARSVVATIATAALTAGKLRVTLFYV